LFPVSASMLKNLADYNASLEAFSRPLMALVNYSLDEEGRMTVQNDMALWYSYNMVTWALLVGEAGFMTFTVGTGGEAQSSATVTDSVPTRL